MTVPFGPSASRKTAAESVMEGAERLSGVYDSESGSVIPRSRVARHVASRIAHPGQGKGLPTIRDLLYASSAARKLEYYEDFLDCVRDMIDDPLVLQMDQFTQHHGTSTYVHCRTVSYYSYLICRRFGLDARSAARAGMVHDLYLYDWRAAENANPHDHVLRHPLVALANAEKRFDLNATEREGIRMHMWPAYPGMPRHPETFVISTVDKYCACIEATGVYAPMKSARDRKIAAARFLRRTAPQGI